MKRIFLFAIFSCCAAVFSFAQTPYNVVFDLTSKDTTDHRMVLRWMKDIVADYPDARLELVLYGKSLDLVTTGKSFAPAAVKEIVGNKNIRINVCSIAMARNHVEEDQLLEGVGTVPDGIYEIISRQADGWGYIKVSH